MTHADLPERLNLTDWFLHRNLANGNRERVALHTPEGPCTYAELSARANQIGNVLRELGIRREERVLLVLGDGTAFVASWFGAVAIGAVAAEVYTFLPTKDLNYFLRYTGARAAIVDATTLAAMREARQGVETLEHLLVAGDAPDLRPGEVALDTAADAASPDLAPLPVSKDDIVLWKFTTGSTGSPKAAVHLAHAPILNFEAYGREVLGLGPDDVVLPVPKLFFGYARDLAALYPIGVGASSVVYPERPTPELLFDLIERHRPTVLVQVPTMMRAMLDHPGAAERDLSSITRCISSGEALPPALAARWTELYGLETLEAIGSCECYHVYASNRPGAVRPGTVGQMVPGYEAAIVSPDGTPLPDGEIGELHVRAPTAAVMYWGDRLKSQRTYVGEWVRTGDLFERDADGYLSSHGRADNLLKVGGIWVAPAEIEHCLALHPDVAECAVVAFERDGLTLPRAVVVLREGATLDAPALQKFVKDRLSPHKYPREVVAVDELPKTPSGKLDRKRLEG
ncbi:MAG: benzoate-CoA ligase family protein [Actinobacteria bacterium]|nr:benzoate-CoA ligase family protein [Actinomycetota bacterium]